MARLGPVPAARTPSKAVGRARAAFARNERGAVYVEFLIAFFPIFLLFLAITQIALITAAEIVVRHSAYAAVRSAIVVLVDDPGRFGSAPIGNLSQGNPSKVNGIEKIVSKLGLAPVSIPGATAATKSGSKLEISIGEAVRAIVGQDVAGALSIAQSGARMVPIRAAGLLPLLPLAPNEAVVSLPSESVYRALTNPTQKQLAFAVEYTKSASEITLHATPDSSALASDIGNKAPVTARTTYLFHCTVPLVRMLMCHSLDSAKQQGFLAAGIAKKTAKIVRPEARFKVLTGSATLPCQGADYPNSGKRHEE